MFSDLVYILSIGRTSPVLRRIGLGAWHASCSSVGFEIMLVTSSSSGLPLVSPEVKGTMES